MPYDFRPAFSFSFHFVLILFFYFVFCILGCARHVGCRVLERTWIVVSGLLQPLRRDCLFPLPKGNLCAINTANQIETR